MQIRCFCVVFSGLWSRFAQAHTWMDTAQSSRCVNFGNPRIDRAKLGSEVSAKLSKDGANSYFVPNILCSHCVLMSD